MPELEFLPSWYPQARRRRRLLLIQAWGTLLVLVAVGAWTALARHNVAHAAKSLVVVDRQLAQSELELVQLQEQLRLKGQLELQRQIVSRLGLPLETSRLLHTLDGLMPKEMSLVELNVDTDEHVARAAMAVRQVQQSAGAIEMDRRLNVRLVGVAPSDLDLANFLASLTGVPFFDNVTTTYSKDKTQGGHVLREFEVTFSLNLNRSAVGE